MSDLIAAVFEDAHTAFLARATLARLQGKLSLSGHDLAVVIREERDEIALQEAVGLSPERDTQPTFWKTLVSQLLAAGFSAEAGGGATAANLAAIGIDATFRSHLADKLRGKASALFVLVTRPAMRDQVLGVLRGFQSETMLTELTGDDPKVWRRTMLGTEQVEEMK